MFIFARKFKHDMRPLSTYIEYLLMTRHYAFVPGIGGFMLQEDSARILRTGEFIPPHRLLKFNRFMDHNDGMLLNAIMRSEGLSYDAANAAMQGAVTALLNDIQREGRCPLGRLGFLFFDKDCHIAFIPTDQMDSDPLYYGLSSLHLKSWQAIEKERMLADAPVMAAQQPTEEAPATPSQQPKLEIGYRREGFVELPTRWIRRASIILLVLTFFFATFLPDSREQKKSDCANVVTPQWLTKHFNTLESQSWDEAWEQTSDSLLYASIDAELADTLEAISSEAETEEPIETAANEAAKIEPEVAQQVATEPTEPVVPVVAQKPSKYYLIIVSSCTSLEDAEYQVKRLAKQGYRGLGIFPRDGRYRIFIDQFEVKTDAETYLESLRSTTSFADAWLLAVRAESLSLIIKNKDNDQLPMELSHLNQSAERDQG